MAKRKDRNWLTCLLAIVVVVQFVPGCGRTGLVGYESVRAKAAKAAMNQTPDLPAEEASVVREGSDASIQLSAKAESSLENSDFLPVSALVPVNMIDGGNVRALMSIPAADVDGLRTGKPSPIADQADPAVGAPSEHHKIELLVKEKTFRTEPKTGAIRLSFDDLDLLKILNMDPVVDNAVELMPDWLRAIDGKTVRLRGFMYPTYEAEGIERFVLARDNQICCFGRDPKIYDLVQIDMKEGKSTNYIPPTRAFDVVGKMKIEMQSQDGKPYGLYSIERAEVIDR